MELTATEQKTAELFGSIHAIAEREHVDASREVLNARHMGVDPDFLVGKRALDAGTGGRGRALLGLYNLGCRDITAADLSEANVQNAQIENASIAHAITYERQNIMELGYDDESFDFIHCSGVLVCVDDPHKGLAEFYRCLKPGGSLYVALYGKGGLLYGVANIARLAARLIPYSLSFHTTRLLFPGWVASNLLDYLYAPNQFHFTEAEASEFIASGGFSEVRRLRQPEKMTNSAWDTYLKPSYYDPNTFIGRLMAGSGWVVMMAGKPVDAE